MRNQKAEPKRKIFYGWFIVAISMAIMAVGYLVYSSWPVFYVAILDEFGWDRAETALIFSVGSMVYGFGSLVAGALFDRLGPKKLFTLAAFFILVGAVGASRATGIWQLILFFGVFVGFGACSAGFVPHSALIANWFEKKRATASGISQMGTRESQLLLPLIQMAIMGLGWQNTYLLLAAITVIVIPPLAQFLRARPQDMGLLPDGETMTEEKKETAQKEKNDRIVDKEWVSTDWTLRRAMKEYRFWSLTLIMLGCGFALYPILNHHVAFVTDAGYTAMFAATLLTIYAAVTLVGRLAGFISDILGREIGFTISSLGTIVAIIPLFFVRDTSAVWLLYFYVIFFGFFGGMYTPAYSAAAADIFQGRSFGAILGFVNIGFGVGASIGTWLFGYIFDTTGTYSIAFAIVISAMAIQIVAMWVAAPRKVRRVVGRVYKKSNVRSE